MKKKILFVIYLLTGLMFINGGLNKLFNYIPVPDDLPENLVKMNEALMAINWLLPLIAIAEIIGGIAFIIPRFRALGALILFPIMVGIILTHIFYVPSGIPMAIILFAIQVWAMIENKEKFLPFIQKN
ncbi:MAG: DoxX family membrane protein [Bacteroidia bacterium]|nr:DoxX family membrane protein [Bacteroidia bacterium]